MLQAPVKIYANLVKKVDNVVLEEDKAKTVKDEFKATAVFEEDMAKVILQGAAGSEIANEVKQHKDLENFRDVELSKKFKISSSTFVWLDPDQMEILSDQNSRVVITAPASTGKTILLQLKIVDLLKSKPKDKVLVLLPNKKLVETYKVFFKGLDNKLDNGHLAIYCPEDNWKVFIETNSPHIFIDEFAALNSYPNFSEQLRSATHNYPEKLCIWITADFKQNLDPWKHDYHGMHKTDIMKNASIHCLDTIHRCTQSVVGEYIKQCGYFAHLGNQHPGITTGANSTNIGDSVLRILYSYILK